MTRSKTAEHRGVNENRVVRADSDVTGSNEGGGNNVSVRNKIQCGDEDCKRWFDFEEVDCIIHRTAEELESYQFFCRSCMDRRYQKLSDKYDQLLAEKINLDQRFPVLSEVTAAAADARGEGSHGPWRVVGEKGKSRKNSVSQPSQPVTPREKVEECKERVNMKENMRKAPPPILMIGDSMIKNVGMKVRLTGNSSVKCMRGANIGNVMKEVDKVAKDVSDEMVIIQGGGNNLMETGVDKTVECMMSGIRRMKTTNKRVRVAVVSVMRRPVEMAEYETARMEVNKKLHSAVMERWAEYAKDKSDGGVSFIDMDHVVTERMFDRDGVHLNEEGERCMAGRLIKWIAPRNRIIQQRSVEAVEAQTPGVISKE